MTLTANFQPYSSDESSLLARALFESHHESELEARLKPLRGIDDPANWAPLGGSVDCAPITRAQQSSGSAALKELVTNARDAMLEQGMSLMDPKARSEVEKMNPENAWLAVAAAVPGFPENFGSVSLALGGDGQDLAKTTPSVTVVDGGVGRSASEFEQTLLSVSKGSQNKRGKSYTCGQFGMGSTGVHAFSGLLGYKAYLSRRKGELQWGVTVARRAPGSDHIEYFCPGGQIPRFEAPEFHPYRQPDGSAWTKGVDSAMSHGTAIKLYDYRIASLGEARSSNSSRWQAGANLINLRMARMPWAVSSKDFRLPEANADKGVDKRWARGLFSELDHQIKKNERTGETPWKSHTMVWSSEEQIGQVIVRVYKVNQKFMQHHSLGNHRVFHHVFGQTHCVQQRKPLLDAKLDALADVALVEVDASGLNKNASNGVWKSDRESLMSNAMGDLYLAGVLALLSEDPTLKQWNSDCLKEAAAEFASLRGGAKQAEDSFKKQISSMLGRKGRGKRQAQELARELSLAADLAGLNPGADDQMQGEIIGEAESLPSAPASSGDKPVNGKGRAQKKAALHAQAPAARSPNKAPSVKQTPEAAAKIKEALDSGRSVRVNARLEAAEADGKSLDVSLFRISNCSSSHVVLAFAQGREEEAMAAIAGKTVVYHLLIEAGGETVRMSSQAVYRTQEEQATREAIAQDRAAEARSRGKTAVAEHIRFLSSDAKSLEKEFPAFNPSMACYAECKAGSLVVIHSNKSHLTLRQMECGAQAEETETQALIQIWEDAVWHMAGFAALSQLSLDPQEDEEMAQISAAERACKTINWSAGGYGQSVVSTSRQLVDAIAKLRAQRRKGKQLIEADA